MKVTIKKQVSLGGYNSYAKGDVIETNSIIGRELIDAGIAEEYKEKEEKQKPSTKEEKAKPKTKTK